MAKKSIKRARESAIVTAVAVSIDAKPSDVPDYLRRGSFYTSLDVDDDNNSFPVPSDAMKLDETLINSDDLVHLLKSLRFWGVDGIHSGIVDFVLNSGASKLKSSIAKFEQNYPYLFTLHEILNLPDQDAIITAIELGDLDLLKCLYEKGFSKSVHHNEYLKYAAKQGQAKCLEYLCTQEIVPVTDMPLNEALKSGCLDCVKCVERHFPVFKDTFRHQRTFPTVTYARLEVFLYCYQYQNQFDEGVLVEAFFCKGIESARRCIEAGVRIQSYIFDGAVRRNNLDIIKLLLESGYTLPPLMCVDAAKYGRLRILQYAYAHGCWMPSETIICAARNDHLHCLQFAHENGCPWPSDVYNYVKSKQSTYKYLVKYGCPRFEEQEDFL